MCSQHGITNDSNVVPTSLSASLYDQSLGKCSPSDNMYRIDLFFPHSSLTSNAHTNCNLHWAQNLTIPVC